MIEVLSISKTDHLYKRRKLFSTKITFKKKLLYNEKKPATKRKSNLYNKNTMVIDVEEFLVQRNTQILKLLE